MDILKIRGKPRPSYIQEEDDIVRMQRAYQKIIFKRMPILRRLLQDFGVKQEDFHEYSFAKLRTLYQPQKSRRKFKDYKPVFQNLQNRKDRFTGPDEGLFEEVRNDRLKAEILVDFDLNINQTTNLSFLESTQELIVSLGDREIFSKKSHNSYMEGNAKIINLLSVLYPNKEQWAAKNIYTTVRINGQSIRSFMYTMNKLYGKDMSVEELYVFYNNNRKDTMQFPEFIKIITGKSLLYYGGGQTKLGKSLDSDKKNIHEIMKQLFKDKFSQSFQYAGGPYKDVEGVEVIIDPKTKLELERLVEMNVFFSPKFRSNNNLSTIMVRNSFYKLPPRKLVTRERQAKEKDFSVKFPVYEMKIINFEVNMHIGDLQVKVRFNSKKLENRIISRLKRKAKSDDYTFREGLSTWVMSSDRQRKNYMTSKPTARQEFDRKYSKKLQQGNLSAEELAEYVRDLSGLSDDRTIDAANRKIESEWRKKLRRKQFPHNLLYLKYNGKYLGLYSTGDIYELGLRS